jgi:hypothetical protein
MTRQQRKDEVRQIVSDLEEVKDDLPFFPKTRQGLLFGLCRHFFTLLKENNVPLDKVA